MHMHALLIKRQKNMKSKSIFVAILLVAIFGAANAQQSTTEVKQDGFNSRVRSVTSTMYEAVVDEGTMSRGEILERLQTEYNAKGQRRSMTYLSQAEDVIFRSRYKHDGFGLTTLEQIVDNNEQVIGRTYYVYNANLALTETYVEDQERQIENRILIKYDEAGRVKERSYNDPLNEVYRREVYTLNGRGLVGKTQVFNRQKVKFQELRYEYDAIGNPTTKTLFDYTEEDPEIFITKYVYKYDENNNWIQKTEYRLEGDVMTPMFITERKIDYYE